MPEYINKQDLLQDIHDAVRFTVARSGKGQTSLELRGANKVLDRIKSAPTANVVEVVRCEECVNAEKLEYKGCLWCSKHLTSMLENDFCSYGERRSEDD